MELNLYLVENQRPYREVPEDPRRGYDVMIVAAPDEMKARLADVNGSPFQERKKMRDEPLVWRGQGARNKSPSKPEWYDEAFDAWYKMVTSDRYKVTPIGKAPPDIDQVWILRAFMLTPNHTQVSLGPKFPNKNLWL